MRDTVAGDCAPTFDPVRLEDRTPAGDAARFPPGENPYYIITPRFVRTSAGVKALHLLCHCLNRAGQEAYVLIYPDSPLEDVTNPDLLTPLITAEVVAAHQKRGVSPIVVYPETIPGNPLGAHSVVRYVLNFPGHLAGDKTYPPHETVFGYSGVLAAAAGAPAQVLFIPASNASLYTPGPPRERRGSCFWAMKYRIVHGGEPLPVTAESVEITRDMPDSQQPEEIAELFRNCELFYTYENTALALEAALCLCPTVFLPNPWLTEVIAARELGMDGFAWGDDPAEIARAKATVHLARERYLATYARFWEQLGGFVSVTQHKAAMDAARRGFPARLAWRVRWRPKIEVAAAACRGTVLTFRQEGISGVTRKLRRRLGIDFAIVVARVTAKVLVNEGPGAVVRKARPRFARRGKAVTARLGFARDRRLPPPQ
jgi:hypothetical protein